MLYFVLPGLMKPEPYADDIIIYEKMAERGLSGTYIYAYLSSQSLVNYVLCS